MRSNRYLYRLIKPSAGAHLTDPAKAALEHNEVPKRRCATVPNPFVTSASGTVTGHSPTVPAFVEFCNHG
jgi:hypothetical protein